MSTRAIKIGALPAPNRGYERCGRDALRKIGEHWVVFFRGAPLEGKYPTRNEAREALKAFRRNHKEIVAAEAKARRDAWRAAHGVSGS